MKGFALLEQYISKKKKEGVSASWTWTFDEISDFFKKIRLRRTIKKIIKQVTEKNNVAKF